MKRCFPPTGPQVSKLAANVAKFRGYQALFELPVDDFAQLALTTQEHATKTDVWGKIATWGPALWIRRTLFKSLLKFKDPFETPVGFLRAYSNPS
jgi:hypothetical protein